MSPAPAYSSNARAELSPRTSGASELSERIANEVVAHNQLVDKVDRAAQDLDERHPRVTTSQKALAQALLTTGGAISDAARSIGKDPGWAYDTLKKPWVAEYCRELAGMVIGVSALRAAAVTTDLLNARSERVRLEAASSILSRAGIEPVSGTTRPIQVAIKL